MKKEMMIPFSNGSEAMDWVDQNCDRCVKALKPKLDKQGFALWPSDKTMMQYCSTGKECKLKYAIDWGFITSEIPIDIAKQIGLNQYGGLNQSCMMFSDNEDDGFKPTKRPRTDPSGPNQMIMPFSIEESLKSKQKELA